MYVRRKVLPKRKIAKTLKKSNKVFQASKPVLNKSIKKYVDNKISRNIEHKITASVNINSAIVTANASSVLQYLVWAPSNTGGLFSISQGTTQSQRIGNSVKLKRWIIKGQIMPVNLNTNLTTQQCYVTVYFGRRNDMNPITASLPSLYNDGGSSVTPTGALMERLYPINKDVYKVYWKKTFKLGLSGLQTVNPQDMPNNDFSLVKTFGFDVCKYICKNKVIKYDDNSTDPTDPFVDSLTIWATIYNASSDISTTPPTATSSLYNLAVNSYAEYTDA